jgi:hypothetical protein
VSSAEEADFIDRTGPKEIGNKEEKAGWLFKVPILFLAMVKAKRTPVSFWLGKLGYFLSLSSYFLDSQISNLVST